VLSGFSPAEEMGKMGSSSSGEAPKLVRWVRGAVAWRGDDGGLELRWRLWFDGNKGMRRALFIARGVRGVAGKDSRPLLSLNLVLIQVLVGILSVILSTDPMREERCSTQ
jgi:hypothetical protein